MLAHALLALLLPFAQAAEPTCRLLPPATTGCFALPSLEGREIHVPANTTRLEPDALRLCADDSFAETVDLGIVLPASIRRTRGMDSAVEGVSTLLDTLRNRGGGDRVALTISRLGMPTPYPMLTAAASAPDPTAEWRNAIRLSTSSENALVVPIGLSRALLDGARINAASSGDGKLLVIFVHGMPADWDPYVRAGLETNYVQDSRGFGYNLFPLQVETHVVLVEDAEGIPAFPILQSTASTRGATAHHLVAPTAADVDMLLRDILANRRDRRPTGVGTAAVEIRNNDLAVSSWSAPFLPVQLASTPLLDSALPLREGPNALEVRRTRRVGPYTLRDTTRLTVVADLPPGTDSLATTSNDAAWICRASQLRIERTPTRDRPLLDVQLKTRATGLTVQGFQVQDSAQGGTARSFLEGGGPGLRWVGNLEAPLDQPGAPFSVSSRGDLIVARWNHPRDARDSARDSVRINPDRAGWVRFTESAISWPGGRLEATAWIPSSSSDSLKASVRCGMGPEKTVFLVRDGETWGAAFPVKAGARPWGDTSLSCADSSPEDSVHVSIRMDRASGDSVLLVDRPVAIGSPLCAVKMRPGSCFDPALLEDHGWLVPRNTTHLDLGSMSLCMPSRKVPAPTRIAWVMDNSGSMQQNDPRNIRFETISRAIIRQSLLNPSTEAGFVRFASSIEAIVPVAPLNPVQTSALLQATRQVQFTGGTNWELALHAALNSFDSSRGTGPAAIVMISDGLPNEGVWTNALRPGMPPVYVIYIGNPSEVSGRPEMESLIRRTGGRLWTLGIAPQQSLMDAAVAEIMGLFETEQLPLRATITSSPLRQNARIATFQKSVGGAYVGQADSLLALTEGGNSFDLQLTTQSSGFPASVRSYPFSLSVERAASPASYDLAGSPFRISCADPGSLRFLDTLGRGIDWQPTSGRRVAMELSPRLPTPSATGATATSTIGASQTSVDLPTRIDGSEPGPRYRGVGPLTAGFPVPGLIIDTLGDTVRGTWCHERVPRDCASGTLALVRVAAAPTIRFVDDSVEGPRGSLVLEVQADALERDTLPVEVSGESGDRVTVLVTRDPDGVHRAVVAFTQVPGEGGSDSLALSRPKVGIATILRARIVTGPDSASATATLERRRDTLVVEPGTDPGTLQVRLRTPDGSAGGRLVVLTGPAGTDSVTLGDDGTAVRPLRTLVGEALDPSRIEAVVVDTLYGDTLRDTTLVEPLPSSRIRFADPLPSGATGRLWLEARVPSSRQVVRASLAWPQGDIEVYLTRDADGLYRTSLPFARGTGASSDTLRLPALRSVELTVTIPPSPTWRGSSDAIALAAPTAAWSVAVKESGRIEVVSDRVDGLPAVVVSREGTTDRTHATRHSGARDSASIATWTFLEESLDSARVEILRIDPVFGDTSRQTVMVPSPWFASHLAATPDTLNPRVGDSTQLEVRDRDLHPERQDTARVTDGTGRTWLLLETSPTSGVFRTRVASRDLAPDWASRAYQAPWTVNLTYADPAHPGDTSRVSVVLVKERPAPESTTVSLTATDTAAASGLLRLEVVSPTGTDTLLAEIAWRDRRDTVTMIRTAEGTFLGTIPYTRWTGPESDTLRLVGPRDLLVAARVLPDTSRTGSSDSLVLRSPRGDLELVRRDSSHWSLTATKVAGPSSSLVVRSGSMTTTLALLRAQDRDTLLVDMNALLPESTDSVDVEFLRVDPVFGDTARRTVRVASPWFPSSLTVSPDSVDPLRAGSVRLRVTDRDRDSGRIDSVRVRSNSGATWTLRETDARSGVYEAQVPVREMASDWASHPNHETWTLALEHVDPDHVADTSRAVLTLRKSPPPPETTSVRLRFHDADAAAGQVTIEVDSPNGHDTAWVVLEGEGTDPDTLRLVRGGDGSLRLERPYTRWTGPDSDTLRWAAQRRLVVRATLLPDSSRLTSRDSAILGSLRPVLVLTPADSVHWTATIGPVEGPSSILRVRLGESSWTLPLVRTGTGDSTRFDPSSFLPESPDSVDLVVEHIDPVYGDTTRQTLRVASPWFQGTLTAQPDTVDAASGTEVVVTLRDRDPNPDRIDTALVVDQDGKEWRLVETAASSGRFELRVPSWALDPQWASRSPGSVHTLRLTRIDPDHPGDTARTEIAIVRGSTGLVVSTRSPLVPVAERGSSDPALRLVDLGSGSDAQQGLVLQTWVPVVAEVFVYDLQGTWVTSGSFRIEPDPATGRGTFMISWNGTDHRGVPVGHGPYPTRIMVRTRENVLLLNQVLVLGRKELRDSGR